MREHSTSAQPADDTDERIGEALSRLTEITQIPVAEHAVVYSEIHATLQDVLAGIDEPAGGLRS